MNTMKKARILRNRIEALESRIAPAFAAVINLSGLTGANGFQVNGEAAFDRSGFSVSGAGDVNGDGFDDIIIGAYNADPNGSQSGASYVLFGKASGFAATLNLSALNGSTGFKIQGQAVNDYSGISVSGAGDVNGDGFDDLIIGARGANPNGSRSGASYVVFGKASGFAVTLNLSTLNGSTGFKIQGVAANDYSGRSVSGAGDVNGDGFDDLIIGADKADPNSSGASYVVFGKSGGFAATLNLSALNGSNGFKLQGEVAYDFSGYSVSGAGDVNGDGFGDLIIGARKANPNGTGSGASYVVFGKATGFGATLNLSTLNGGNGFKIQGEAALDNSGTSVSGAGDVNGDGFDDLIIGADKADPNGSNSGASYVVFGKASGFGTTLNLSALNGSNGFKIAGEATSDYSGRSVSGAGDVNGDGFDDLIIGAKEASPNGSLSGASYVVFGKSGGFAGLLNLSALNGSTGFKIQGEAAGDLSGSSVSGAGDVNGDGFDDLIIGAFKADPHGSYSGSSYVVFGKGAVITINDGSVMEANTGTVNAVFTVTLSEAVSVPVTVSYATANGSATAPGDYMAISPTVLTFAPGETSRTMSVAVFGDTVFETNETFFVNLSNAGHAIISDAQGVGTIINDDTAPVISIADAGVTEGNAGTVNADFIVSLSAAAGVPVIVTYATANGTAASGDYTTRTPTLLTFAPGETSKVISVAVLGDAVFEYDDTFFVNLSNPGNATIGDAQGVGTILNDDTAPVISIGDAGVAEGNSGSVDAVFTVNLSAAAGVPVTVMYATANGTALAGDYTAVAATLLNFLPGETIKTISVAVLGDMAFEFDDTFFVNLSNPGNATLDDAQGIATITNDDEQPVISIGDVSVAEGNSGSVDAVFTVSLSAAAGVPVTVSYATANRTAGSDDYAAVMATLLTFAPGETTKTISVAVTSDAAFEFDDTFFVNLSDSVNATLGVAQAVGTITNDDDQPVLSIGDVSVIEGNAGTVDAVFTVSLSAAAGVPVLVTYATANGTALAGDYTAVAATLLTFAAGETSRTISVAVLGDMLFEFDDTFSVNLSDPGNATLGDAQGIATIINDDDQPVLSIADVSVAEGNLGTANAVFIVSLSAAAGVPVTVTYATADGTAVAPGDYAALTETQLIFAPGETSRTITVAVTGDANFEVDETFLVNLTSPVNATLGDAQGIGTIINDDGRPTISIADASVAEGDSGTTNMVFTVRLSAESFEPVTVTYATANGTAAAPGDYTAQRPAQLVFAPGETGKTISIAVFGETLFEKGADETFFVILGGAVNAAIADVQATGTILNDDAGPAGVFTIDAKHPFTFQDANNDTVTVKLKGAGTGTVSLDGGVAGGADISEITLTGTDSSSALIVSVKKDRITGDGAVDIGEVTVTGVLKAFDAKAADLTAGGLIASGVVKKVTARNLVHGAIITGGVATDKFALTLGAVGDGTLIQSGAKITALKAAQLGAGVVSAAEFGAITTSAGGIAAEITSVGAIAKIIIKGGPLSGEITAARFGAVTVTGGDFSGTLTSLTPAATLAKTAALKSLAIVGGDITGDVRVFGAAGTISVKATKTGPGGNVIGASIVASAIGALSIKRDTIASHILAGANLGTDHAPGGGDDTFGGGTIGNVKIGGSVSGASVIGAGLSSINATFKDSDDTIIGGAASVVKRLAITGTADADSYFAAGLFKAPPKVGSAQIDPAADGRFKVG